MEEIEQETITAIIGRVATALEGAVAEHGATAVDLGLLAYRVDAAQAVVFGLIFLVPLAFIPKALNQVRNFEKEADFWGKGNGWFLFCFVVIPASFVCLSVAFSSLTVVNLFAAFGYPELLIATRALEAGGLL